MSGGGQWECDKCGEPLATKFCPVCMAKSMQEHLGAKWINGQLVMPKPERLDVVMRRKQMRVVKNEHS